MSEKKEIEAIEHQKGGVIGAGNGRLEENFRKYVLTAMSVPSDSATEEKIEEEAKRIYDWARKNGAQYFAFLTHPRTQKVSQKQETFLDLDYFFDGCNLNCKGKNNFNREVLLKGEGDGSSFPSGGARVTHSARAYTIWDSKSEIFIRKNNKVMYIPSLLISHDGLALDDKTLFRNCEKILNENSKQLLQLLGIKASAVTIALGLEQEFFVIPSEAYDKRLDIKSTGRALYGKIPPKNQQFSDHYYGKLPEKMEHAFQELQQELIDIGVPVKTRHKEVAPNQYEFVPLFLDAGKTLDHNMIMMEIMKEVFQKHGLKCLLHEKPFQNLNGSGKHANWSLNFIDEEGKVNNLFKMPKNAKDATIFKLFVLINLMAIQNNAKLYLSSIAVAGNQIRLGGHEAPPRIISVFLGSSVQALLDGKQLKEKENFKDIHSSIRQDVYQEDTDRNRTSPYAYTGNKFEFRAVGSSQNVAYPMAVIAGTLAKEIAIVTDRLKNGETVEEIITDLTEKTQKIRFSGNGYSPEWIEEAKKRGLYANNHFTENYETMKETGNLFVEIGATREETVRNKFLSMKELYITTVVAEATTMQRIIEKDLTPRCFDHLAKIQGAKSNPIAYKYADKFVKAFESVVQLREQLEIQASEDLTLSAAEELRSKVIKGGELIDETLRYLPRDERYPELEDILGLM